MVLCFVTCYLVLLGFATHCLMVLSFCSNLLFNKGFRCRCSNCEGFELLIGSMYYCSTWEGFELFTGPRCCCFDRCSTKVMYLLFFNLFFLAMLSPLKFVLLTILIQVFLTSLGIFEHVL